MSRAGKTLAIVSAAAFAAFGYALAMQAIPLLVISFAVAVVTKAMEEAL